MGLDITAYKNLKNVENPKFDEDGELENWRTEWTPGGSMEWSEKHWPGRGKGVEPEKVYTFEEEFRFRAGSYSGYNWWRNKLELFAEGEDFQELINFSDCEGVIGQVVSKKLAEDFVMNKAKAVEYSLKIESENRPGKWWLEQYELWREAFEFAAQNGAVDFH